LEKYVFVQEHPFFFYGTNRCIQWGGLSMIIVQLKMMVHIQNHLCHSIGAHNTHMKSKLEINGATPSCQPWP
jgi:hypothetical protein